MRLLLALLVALVATVLPASAQEPRDSINRAIALFDAAAPRLGGTALGVDVAAYGDALTLGRFHRWGDVNVDLVVGADPGQSCQRFAAYTLLPPEQGTVPLVFCVTFFTDGTEALRTLTVLHEMVHVVAGPDECRAMAFAALVEQLATGSYTPVDDYWVANGCVGGAYSLPSLAL